MTFMTVHEITGLLKITLSLSEESSWDHQHIRIIVLQSKLFLTTFAWSYFHFTCILTSLVQGADNSFCWLFDVIEVKNEVWESSSHDVEEDLFQWMLFITSIILWRRWQLFLQLFEILLVKHSSARSYIFVMWRGGSSCRAGLALADWQRSCTEPMRGESYASLTNQRPVLLRSNTDSLGHCYRRS